MAEIRTTLHGHSGLFWFSVIIVGHNPLGAAKFHVSNSNENFCNCSLMKFKKLLFVGIFENCFIQLITA